MPIHYIYNPQEKKELVLEKKGVVLVYGKGNQETFTLKLNEFNLAKLFDGTRSKEQVLDTFYSDCGIQVPMSSLDAFVEQLSAVGLLEARGSEEPVATVSREGRWVAGSSGDSHSAESDDDFDVGRFSAWRDRQMASRSSRSRRVPLARDQSKFEPAAGADANLTDAEYTEADSVEEGFSEALDDQEFFAVPDDQAQSLADDGVELDEGNSADPPVQRRLAREPRSPQSPGQRLLEALDSAEDPEPTEQAKPSTQVRDRVPANALIPPARERFAGWGSAPSERAQARRPGAGARQPASGRNAGPKYLFKFSVAWLMPIGRLFTLPVTSKLFRVLLIAVAPFAWYGLWANHVQLFGDFARVTDQLALAGMLLLSMFTVNLLGQLGRSEIVRKATGKPPGFGVILAFNLLPRFYADLSQVRSVRDVAARYRILSAALSVTFFIHVLAAFGWLIVKDTPTFLPALMLGITALSALVFLITVNPLSRREGYYLLASKLGVYDLRERAFATLMGKELATDSPRRGSRGKASKEIPAFALSVYGTAVLVYLGFVSYLIYWVIGRWLEANWGGLGVIIFLVAVGVAMSTPIKQMRANMQVRDQVKSRRKPKRASSKAKQRVSGWLKFALFCAVLAGLGSIPYTFEPGGELNLLPVAGEDVRALISGDIRKIYVAEGDLVTQGQVLAQLSNDEEVKNIAVSEASLGELRANLSMAETGATKENIELARQKVKTAKSKYNFSREEANRYEGLWAKKVISRQEYEDVRRRSEIEYEQYKEAQLNLEVVLSGTRSEEIEAIRSQIGLEEAELAYHKRQLEYTQLISPVSGRIVSGSLSYALGNYLERGELFATIEDDTHLVGEIKVPESDIGEVKPGAKVRFKAWAYPDREFFGTVESIAPNAEETPYGKVIRVKTRIDNKNGVLKSEMTGYAKITGSTQPAGLAFTRMIVRFFAIEIWSWLP